MKLLGAYTLPYDIQLSGTFQSSPGPEITASATFVNAQIAPSLGRTCRRADSTQIGLVEPKTEYGERLYQLDFRFAKRFIVNRARFQATVDLYNALNGNTVLVQSNTLRRDDRGADRRRVAAAAGDPPGPHRQVRRADELLSC